MNVVVLGQASIPLYLSITLVKSSKLVSGKNSTIDLATSISVLLLTLNIKLNKQSEKIVKLSQELAILKKDTKPCLSSV